MMKSIVDRYYRKISQDIDNVRMKFNISSLLVKSKDHDSKIDDIETIVKNNKTKTENNLNLISSNKVNISKNIKEIYNKHLLITSVDNQRYSNHKKLI